MEQNGTITEKNVQKIYRRTKGRCRRKEENAVKVAEKDEHKNKLTNEEERADQANKRRRKYR